MPQLTQQVSNKDSGLYLDILYIFPSNVIYFGPSFPFGMLWHKTTLAWIFPSVDNNWMTYLIGKKKNQISFCYSQHLAKYLGQ